MKRVYVASPFRGATPEETRQNIIYARLCMLDSLERGEAPYLSHLLYTQVWAESDDLRAAGLAAGTAWRRVSDYVALYIDLGVTDGMRLAELDAAHHDIPHGYRKVTLPGVVLETPETWRETLAQLPLDPFPALVGT
jgi:hypothetical protein